MFRAALSTFVLSYVIGNCWMQRMYPASMPVSTVQSGSASPNNLNQLQPNMRPDQYPPTIQNPTTCSCGIFLSGQFTRGSPKPPVGEPVVTIDLDDKFMCQPAGIKLCMNKCLENLPKHLPKNPEVICGFVDRNCFKERAHLFVKNCNSQWTNSNLAAGREFCCKDGESYNCPSIPY